MTLTQKLNEAAAVQDLLPNTVRTYQHWARQFYAFNRMPASQWTGEEVTRWLCELHRLNYSASSRKQALNAIAFIFKHVIKADMGKLALPPMPSERRTLRVIPSREELGRIFAGLRGQTKLMAGLMLGHDDLATTAIYTQADAASGVSPMDCEVIRAAPFLSL